MRKTMDGDEEPSSHFPQCSAGSAKGRRNVEVKSSNERLELTLGVKTSKPQMSIALSSCVCEDDEACLLGTVYAKVEPSLSDVQHGEDKGTAAAQTQMPSTKPKARTLVARRQLIDGNEAASLRDQSPLPLLTLGGTVASVSTDPSRIASLHISIAGKASASAAQQDGVQGLNRRPNREVDKYRYYKELCLQIEERKQQKERERTRNAADEQKHNDTMQHSFWGKPGSGTPNYHLGTMRRTRNLYAAGILPQEQIRDKGFSGTPFHRL